ncbi:MAG: DUF4159 domain-containing protein [Gemmatimonadetes bacterium]|jgi:hypothetical protein|nr:DUF4159 domain-containing protein [Gemmatimonadota bacterium]MBT6147615.1 DUF4159 domain-containing protein [Gemmatimonadota bacterium]MBT7860471.1 DUF4159 domain-containing protein [Gemmatimonadota bacterium]
MCHRRKWWPGLPGLLLLVLSTTCIQARAQVPTTGFTIARVQYDGGGDWYSDPSSLPNLLRFIGANTTISVATEEARVQIDDEDLFAYPYLYLTGHGNIHLSDQQVQRLRRYLDAGGFLHADDNYGLDESFRREMKRLYPSKDFVELPADHEIFHCHFSFPRGLPKIHEHDGSRPQALALFEGERILVVYTYESDLGDGWEDAHVHDDPEPSRLAALRMGTNIVVWALSR